MHYKLEVTQITQQSSHVLYLPTLCQWRRGSHDCNRGSKDKFWNRLRQLTACLQDKEAS